MVQFSLPENSKILKGKYFKDETGSLNLKIVHIYRWDPEKNENPREDFPKRDDENYMKHTLSWHDGKEVKINYRPVNLSTLTNDVQTFPPKERVY